MDNNLSGARRGIGESSNLAQICLSYSYTYPEETKYKDYCAILSVLAQILIDSAKRRHDVDALAEVARIKEDMHIEKHGYPAFWALIRPGFNKDKINPDIICPMNTLLDFHPGKPGRGKGGIPISRFLSIYPADADIKLCKSVEELINKYNIGLYSRTKDAVVNEEIVAWKNDDYYLLLDGFDELINDIKKLTVGEKYIGLFSWILNKIFSEDVDKEIESAKFNNMLQTNRSLVLKVLYDLNKDVFLKCFEKNITK